MRFFCRWFQECLKQHTATAVLLGFALAGGLGLAVFSVTRASAQSAALPVQAVPVATAPGMAPKTVPLQRLSREEAISADGTVQSTLRRHVDSTLSYRVSQINVDVGDAVYTGQVLAQLDGSDLDAEIAQLQKEIETAQAGDTLELTQAQEKLDAAKATLAEDELRLAAALETARLALDAARKADAYDIALRDTEKDLETAEEAEDLYRAALSAYEVKYNEIMESGQFSDEALAALDELYQVADQKRVDWESLLVAYTTKWNNVYTAALASVMPSPETKDYEEALENQTSTLQEDRADITEAQNALDACQLESSAAAQQADLETLLARRQQLAVVAPMGGTITEVNAQVGLLPSATRGNSALFVLEDHSRLAVEALVPQRDALLFPSGLSATVTAQPLAGQSWQVSLASISPIADSSGNFTVSMEFPTTPTGLRAGMQAHLRFDISTTRNVLAAPEPAVWKNAQGQNVVRLYTPAANGQLYGSMQEIVVSTHPAKDGLLEISGEGLAEGDLLVVPESIAAG